VEGHHHVVLLAAAQRVVHQVAVGADPDAGGVPLQVVGEVGFLSTTARYTTWPVTRGGSFTYCCAHHRLAAVGADQRHPGPALAVLVDHGDAVGLVLLDALDAGAGVELDLAGFLRAFEQRGVMSTRWITA
jgi:hypothetical protein